MEDLNHFFQYEDKQNIAYINYINMRVYEIMKIRLNCLFLDKVYFHVAQAIFPFLTTNP